MQRQFRKIAAESGARSIATAFYDYESKTSWSYYGDRWFHAASTIKVPILVALFDAIEAGRFALESRLHVRNRFLSVVDEEPYRVAPERDANAGVHEAIGRMMRIGELARHMIVTSSNLATNLLLELVGVEEAQQTLKRVGVEGVRLQRGVEDEKAFEAGINNMVTANGLLRVFRLLQDEEAFPAEASRRMLDILHMQEFRSGIPAGLPEPVRDRARIAHKTGEISTVAHDAGLVYLPERKPYALVILTEWDPEQGGRHETLAKISRLVYEHLTEEG